MLPIGPVLLGLLDVRLLMAFVTANQKKDEPSARLRVVHAPSTRAAYRGLTNCPLTYLCSRLAASVWYGMPSSKAH